MFGFVLVMIVLRATIDAARSGSGESGPLATLAGAVFILASLGALSHWAMEGTYRATSGALKAAYAVVIAAFLSVPLSDHQGVAAVAAVKILAGVLMFAVLEQLLPGRPDRVRALLRAVLGSALIPLAFAGYQYVSKTGDHLTPGYNRLEGTSITPVTFSTYLLIVALLAFALVQHRHAIARADVSDLSRRSPWVVTLAVVAALACILTYTRSAWIALGLGFALLFWRLNRRWLIPIAGVAVYAVSAIPDLSNRLSDLQNTQGVSSTAAANSLSWRFSYWQQIIPLAHSNPLTGIGIDTVQSSTTIGLKPHNLIVEAYVEMGLVGLAAVTAMVVLFAVAIIRRRRHADTQLTVVVAGASTAILAAVLLQSMTTNILTQTLIWWYLAAATAWGFGFPHQPTAVERKKRPPRATYRKRPVRRQPVTKAPRRRPRPPAARAKRPVLR